MDVTELEEGEACSYSNNDEYDTRVDPDVALSYIDEKLQHVLGHLQKDFEGGVSAEALGAKFGGYGSFLPACQRSPVCSCSRAQPNHQSYNASRSPRNLPVEGNHQNYAIPSITSQLEERWPTAITAETALASNGQSKTETTRQEMGMMSTNPGNFDCGPQVLNDKSGELLDKKMIKVRIKVPDNLSTRKTAVIYSDLGLGVSPSSSLDDSHSESEHMYQGTLNSLNESPTSILQVMTSFPVHEDLLSPLPDVLLNLIEKEKCRKESRHDFGECGELFHEKKMKTVDINVFPSKLKHIDKDHWDDNGIVSKDTEIDTLACDELVSNTLKLPLLSDSQLTIRKMKNICEVRNNFVHDVAKGYHLEPIIAQDVGLQNMKSASVTRIMEDKRTSSLSDDSGYPRKNGHPEVEKPYKTVKSDLDTLKGKKTQSAELLDLPKQVCQMAVSNEHDRVKLPPAKECSSFEGKRKSKGIQNNGTSFSELSKENMKACSSIPKNKKTTQLDAHIKAEDAYKEFFGDMEESDQEENRTSLLRICSENRSKDSEIIYKGASVTDNMSKARSYGKKSDKSPSAEAHLEKTMKDAPHPAHMNISEAVHPTAASATNDSWVCCDKCQKWRLLPAGLNPDNLPEKWICSMLKWLPGMNRCNITEEETTKAVHTMYQGPISRSEINLHGKSSNMMSTIASTNLQCADQDGRTIGSYAMSNGESNKHDLIQMSNTMNKDGLTQLLNPLKEIHASVRNETPEYVDQTIVGKPKFWNQSKSSDLHEDEINNRQKKKHYPRRHDSEEGNAKSSKLKGKEIIDQDCVRAFKKMRAETSHFAAEDVPCSNTCFPALSEGTDQPKHNKLSSSKESRKDRLQDSAKVPKEEHKVPLDRNGASVTEKGKMDDCLNNSFSDGGDHIRDSKLFVKEEFSRNDCGKEKRFRVSKSVDEGPIVRKPNHEIERTSGYEKNIQQMCDLGNASSQGRSDGLDSMRKDSAPMLPSVAATSSSSKVSGSHKSKRGSHEGRDSPVESVSSSPMRIINSDKLTRGRRNAADKDEFHGVGHFTTDGPRRCSDGYSNGGSDSSETTKREKSSSDAQHGSRESFAVDFHEKDTGWLSGDQAKVQAFPSPDTRKCQLMNSIADYSGQEAPSTIPRKATRMDRHHSKEETEKCYSADGRKSDKGSSQPSDKICNFRSHSINELEDHAPSFEVKPTDGRNNFKSDEIENGHMDNKESTGKQTIEGSKREGTAVKMDATLSQDAISTANQSLPQDKNGGRSTEKFIPYKGDQLENVSARRNSLLPPSEGAQTLRPSCSPQEFCGSQKGNGVDAAGVDATQADERLKTSQEIRKADDQSAIQLTKPRQTKSAGNRVKDLEAPSLLRKDPSNHAATSALKEAKDLKHLADRLKNSGSNQQTAVLYYFQAAMKFLHGAFLLESCGSDSGKQGEMIQCMQIYSSTGKLCEFCAHEYEKLKDMAAAALAYKCMEVAYMRVVYFSHSSAGRTRHELQSFLQTVASGESPSSAFSVDNINHPTTMEKTTFPKGSSSPQVAGNNVMAARNRSILLRLLNFTQDVNFAMEAARKSKAAYGVAKVSLEEAHLMEGITAVKKALDFNFQDVEALLRLVRLAMDAIGH